MSTGPEAKPAFIKPGKQPAAVVIGGGAAGLTAALVLAREGVQVTTISKVKAGNATCTIYAGGGFTLGIEGMAPEEHRKMTYETGRRLNVPKLLDTFSAEGPSIVDFLREAGVPFRLRRGGLSVERQPAFPLLGGKSLTDGLCQACANAGVEFAPNLIAMRLLSGDGGICGVECIDHSSGRVLSLQAGAVVLATGGAGALYERTDNPQRITGDGYRLALDASCRLMDMEFVQFYPMGFDTPGGAHWFLDLGIIDKARVTGPDGREFLREMLLREGITSGGQANLLARDKCSVAISLANEKGQSLLHLEDIPEERWRSDSHLSNVARMFPHSSPPWMGPVPLHPIEHYFPGGVTIGTHGETEVPGLFACGEVTGGVDGANRVGGNALTNCILFGMKSGALAARHARGEAVAVFKAAPGPARFEGTSASIGGLPAGVSEKPVRTGQTRSIELPRERSAAGWLELWTGNVGKPESTAGAVSPADLRSRLKEFSTRYLLPYRRGSALEEAQSSIADLMQLLDRQAVRDSRDLLLAAENLGLWHAAAMVSSGALLRAESRGAHYREDFPKEDPAWQRHIYMSRQGGSLVAARDPE